MLSTNSSEEETKEEFYDELQAVMDKVSNRCIVKMMGDMNAKVGCDNTGKIKSAYLDTCVEVLGKRGEERRWWISEETWKKID